MVARLTAVPDTARLPDEVAAALPVAAMSAFKSPAATTEISTPDRVVAPKKELFGLVRAMSPVDEVIEEGAPVIIAPVWVMSPTEVVVRPPVRLVTPKLVAPPELVARLTAVPDTVRLPAAVAAALPVAATSALRSPAATTVTSTPARVVAPKNEFAGFVRVISPVDEVIEEGAPVVIAPVCVMSPTEVVVRPPVSVVTPKEVAPPELVARLIAEPDTVRLPVAVAEALPVAAMSAFRSPAETTVTSTPESAVAPKKELFGLVRVMSPVDEVIEEGAPVVIAPVCVMSPTDTVVRPPVSVVVPKEVAPPEVVVREPATEPAKLRSPSVATRLVAPKKELPGFARVMSPVDEVIEEGAPVVIAPVCVMSPTERVVRPPVRVVRPKLVVPPELVARLTAVPDTARLPDEVAAALPVAAMRAVRSPAATTVTSTPTRLVAPKKEFAGFVRVISPVDEVIEEAAPVVIAPVCVMSPTDTVVRPPVRVVRPKLVVPPELVARLTAVPDTVRLPVAVAAALPVAAMSAFKSPAATTVTSTPERLVAPKNEFAGLVRAMSPVDEVIEEGAPVVIAPVWVMSATEVVVRPPVSVVTPKLVAPPEVVAREPATEPAKLRSPSVATRLVVPKNALSGFVRMMSPVDEVIEEGAPVVIAPVCVMSPTEVVVRPPVSVVTPKEVAPPELVVKLTAVPAIARLPLVATATFAPLTVTRPRRSLPALLKVMPVGTPPWVAVAEVLP